MALNSAGIRMLSQQKIEEAIEAFTKAIELDLNYAPAYNNRDVAMKILGRLQEAEHGEEARTRFRGEAGGTKTAEEADFLISFSSIDRDRNNSLLGLLNEGVLFHGEKRCLITLRELFLGALSFKFYSRRSVAGSARTEVIRCHMRTWVCFIRHVI